MSRSAFFLMLVLSLVMIPHISGAGGLKIKVSSKGVEVGPVKIAPPPEVQIVQKLAAAKNQSK
jgi:hypothetical protein